MKKRFNLALLLISLMCILSLGLVACGDDGATDNSTPASNQPSKDSTDPFSTVQFVDKTVTYDGNTQSISVTGLPTGATVTYTNNDKVDAGEYTVTANLSKDDKTATKTAKLTINKATFTGITFADLTKTYDGEEYSILATGAPAFATVTYEDNKGTNAGTYNAKVKVTAANYNDYEATATLLINKATFTGITFTDLTATYDATEKSIVAGNVPAFATASYTDNKKTAAGSYTAKVKVTAANYNDYETTATLLINKATLGDFTFKDDSVEYDTKAHTITITGTVPDGESVVYTGGEDGKNGATNVGVYNIKAVIGGTNYVAKEVTAKLTIKSTEELLYSVLFKDVLYFQNALDGNKLYSYDGTDLVKVSFDKPESFLVASNDKLYYLNQSILGKGIVSFDGTAFKNLLSISGEYLATDGDTLYFANNSLLKAEDRGIYKIAIADLTSNSTEPVPTRITTNIKTESLVYSNGYIYFANKSDGSKLYRVSASASTPTEPTKVYDYKVSDIIADGNHIYFTRHITLSNLSAGAAIYSINTSSLVCPLADDSAKITKISNAKGQYLAVCGDYLFFVNVDKALTTIFGDGIYKVKKDGSNWSDTLIGGTKVVDGTDNGIYSLSTDGTNIYYYRANNKHIYCFDGDDETDLMEGFTPPTSLTVLTPGYEQLEKHGNAYYYINTADGGKLYKYDLATSTHSRMTSQQVAGFAFNGDYIYYATVRLGVNFDLYRANLITCAEEKISEDKCLNFVFKNDKIYYGNYSSSNTLNVMDLDGSNDTVLFNTKSLDNCELTLYNNCIIFVADGTFYKYDLDLSTASVLNSSLKPFTDPDNNYVIANGIIYYMQDAATKNSLASYNISTNTYTELASVGMTDGIKSIMINSNKVLFYRNKAAGSSDKGLYSFDTVANKLNAITDYFISNGVIDGDYIYFMDAWVSTSSVITGSGNLCKLSLSDYTVTVL